MVDWATNYGHLKKENNDLPSGDKKLLKMAENDSWFTKLKDSEFPEGTMCRGRKSSFHGGRDSHGVLDSPTLW